MPALGIPCGVPPTSNLSHITAMFFSTYSNGANEKSSLAAEPPWIATLNGAKTNAVTIMQT